MKDKIKQPGYPPRQKIKIVGTQDDHVNNTLKQSANWVRKVARGNNGGEKRKKPR